MKLVIAAEIFPPDIGGPATYSKRLAEALSAHGWDVRLICYSDQKHDDSKYPFKINRIIRGKFVFWRYLRYFSSLLILSLRVDVIYAMGPVSSGFPAVLVKMLLRKKLAVKVVGDYAWERYMNDKVKKSISATVGIDEFQNEIFSGKVGILRRIESYVVHKANVVITPSEYLKRLVSRWGSKVITEKIKVVYNSVDLINRAGASDRESARNKLGFTTNDFVIVSVGRPVSWKGFGMLAVGTAELIKEKGIPIKLRILGLTTNDELKKLIKLYNDRVVYETRPLDPDKFGPNREVIMLRVEDKVYEIDDPKVGVQPKPTVYEYLLASDAFVLNTAYEGLSHVILEAMFVGTPVVTTRVGGNSELIKPEENGILIPFNEKEELKESIIRLYSDINLRKKFIENSKVKLKQFTGENMIDRTMKVLNSL